MTKSRHTREDLVGRLGPHERLRARIGDVDIASDGSFQLVGAAVHAAAQHPRTARRCEVHVHARVSGQPAMNERRFVGTGVVHDEVDVEHGRHRRVDGVEEPAKLARPVARVALADDLATLDVQRREEGGCPVARGVMGAPLGLARAHRQHRLRAIERLDLRFLVDTEHEGLVGGIEVQPHWAMCTALARAEVETSTPADEEGAPVTRGIPSWR